jgi:hypothetical protein
MSEFFASCKDEFEKPQNQNFAKTRNHPNKKSMTEAELVSIPVTKISFKKSQKTARKGTSS